MLPRLSKRLGTWHCALVKAGAFLRLPYSISLQKFDFLCIYFIFCSKDQLLVLQCFGPDIIINTYRCFCMKQKHRLTRYVSQSGVSRLFFIFQNSNFSNQSFSFTHHSPFWAHISMCVWFYLYNNSFRPNWWLCMLI